MIVVIDHFDSFVETLARYLREAGEPVVTIRQNAPLEDILAHQPKALILSPGPGTPDETGISLELLAACPPDMPVLGVCLGHQTLAQAFGGSVGRALEPMHGKASTIHHNGDGLFADLPQPMQAGRYHALIVEKLPDCLRATAHSAKGEIMAFAHVSRPVFGVQFHPESILTPHGRLLIDNFLACMKQHQPGTGDRVMAAVLINGQPVAPAQLALAQDRGLLLGESVFETVLVKNGIPQFWEAHIKRLRAACDFYGLNPPADNLPARDLGMALKQWARALLAENTADEPQVLRLTISGGAGGRGLVPQQAADALCLVSLSPAPPPLACVKLYVSDYGLLAGQPDAAFKTGNYLPNIQARKQAIAHGADEALMLNQWGRIASAAAGNVIIETGDGQWLTPALAEGALPGIMLAQLRQLPDSPIKQGQVTPAMLETARHIFICNSVMEIVAAHFEAADASPIEAATQKARQWRALLPVETVF